MLLTSGCLLNDITVDCLCAVCIMYSLYVCVMCINTVFMCNVYNVQFIGICIVYDVQFIHTCMCNLYNVQFLCIMYVQFLFAVPIMYSILDSISAVNILYINTV